MNNIIVLPGDGIGPEIVNQALRVLIRASELFELDIIYETADIGGASIDRFGTAITDGVLQKCRQSKAVLLGAVGGPKWESTRPDSPRPEDALLKLRKELGLFANLRPVKVYDNLLSASALKEELIKGVDILFLRELTGDVYFGKKERVIENGIVMAYDTMIYRDFEIERIAKLAFEMAKLRRGKVASVEKANVVESSRLWREIVTEVHRDYRDVELMHMYVDNAAMQLVKDPRQFDVIVTSNMFGDILSDEAAMIAGSIGLIPSASLRQDGFGLYEPIHGSAPDIAGKGIANPLATILSVAMMLEVTFKNAAAARSIENAVSTFLDKGYRTADIYNEKKGPGGPVSTAQAGDIIIDLIE